MTVYTLFLYIGIAAIVLMLTLGLGHAKLKKYERMRPLLWFFQYFVGSLLIFSGLVKALDPLGTAYKMADYFTLLLPMLSFMKPFALPFALVMIVIEIVVGINLILGHGKQWTTSLNLLMMLFFTFLTGYNYFTGYLPEGVGIFDFGKWQAFKETSIKVSDCGCFGDFMKLLPIETFGKDIILTAISLFLLIKTKDLKFLVSSDTKLGKATLRGILTTVFSLGVTVFCLMNFYFGLPMVDFRPFREGTNLGLARAECAANPPIKKILYTYKNRVTEQIKLVDASEIGKYPFLWTDKMLEKDKTDSVLVWEIQKDKTKEELITKGCDSKVSEMDGTKQLVFATHGYALWVVADDIYPKNTASWKKIRAITDAARKDGVEATAMYHGVHSDEQNAIEIFRHANSLAFDFIQSDEKLVKTIIRSSPGLLLLHNGTVVKMWHHRQLPSWDYIKLKYAKKVEPDLELNVKIEGYIPNGPTHTFKCKVEKVEKGQLKNTEFDLMVLDGNTVLLKQLVNEESGTGAVEGTVKLSMLNRPDLVSKNEKVNFVANGFLDKERKAWQIVEVKK